MDYPTEFLKLRIKYPYVVAWGQLLGSHGYYIMQQLEFAEQDNAPSNATYKKGGEIPELRWATVDSLNRMLQDELEGYVNGTKGGAIINF